jgi:hypothetical protein
MRQSDANKMPIIETPRKQYFHSRQPIKSATGLISPDCRLRDDSPMTHPMPAYAI